MLIVIDVPVQDLEALPYEAQTGVGTTQLKTHIESRFKLPASEPYNVAYNDALLDTLIYLRTQTQPRT